MDVPWARRPLGLDVPLGSTSRFLDPDQDDDVYSSAETYNSVGTFWATAVGPYSRLSISIVDFTGGGVPSVTNWSMDPYELLLGGNIGNGDYTIGMAWNLGTIGAGQSKTLSFEYQVSSVPIPAGLLLLGPGLAALTWFRKRIVK